MILAVMAGTGCSTPHTASGSLDQGKQRVVELVLDAARALPATAKFRPPTEVGTQPCRKTLAGFTIGETGAHRAEVPLLVQVPPAPSPPALLARIEAAWTKAGYRIDRSRIHESGFPQIRAHAGGGYDVVATAFAPPHQPQIDLYSVSPCLRG